MTREQLIAEASIEDAKAVGAEANMRSMERTTERTNGVFGHLNGSHQYAGWQRAAAEHRKKAADLRAQADQVLK